MQTCAETHVNRTREQVLSVQGSWRTNLEQVLGRACVFALHGGSQSLMQGRAEQTCGKWRKQNVVAPPRSSAGRPTRWLWSLPRGQLPCDLSFVERLRFDGNPKPNTYENQHCPSGRFGSQMTPVSMYWAAPALARLGRAPRRLQPMSQQLPKQVLIQR